jgi:fatty-acid peroxygenase
MTTARALQPSERSFGKDQTLTVLREGYQFWSNQRKRHGRDAVRARVAGERMTCLRGADAARFFYEEPTLARSSALPPPIVGSLFGRGGVQTLDGGSHVHRKGLLTGVLTAEAVGQVVAGVARRWDEQSIRWRGRIDVFDEVAPMLLAAACDWVGLPVQPGPSRAADMLAMVDGFGSPGPRHWRAHRARRRTERWVEGHVQDVRDGAPATSPLGVVARHRDDRGDLLPVHTAAVEVINLVRPTVAISWLASGAALAMDSWPALRRELADETMTPLDVAQEIRRYYPFAPFLAARATQDVEWSGVAIPRGTLVVLDVWGTNHDPRIWTDPFAFDPSRFGHVPVTPYNLVPQGGGDRHLGHRCPGEDLTLAVLTTLVPRIAALPFDVVGDRPDLRRMPPAPHLSCAIRTGRSGRRPA